jgi:hypothetical protein
MPQRWTRTNPSAESKRALSQMRDQDSLTAESEDDGDDERTSSPIAQRRGSALLLDAPARSFPKEAVRAVLYGAGMAVLFTTAGLTIISQLWLPTVASPIPSPPPHLPPPHLPSPSPSLPPSPPPPPPIVWDVYLGLNCSGGGHGAFNLGPAADAAVPGAASVRACQDSCARVARYGCEAILFNADKGRCYHRRYIERGSCTADASLTLYVRTDPRLESHATPLIVDTDMSFDVDDVGAVCVAHALHDLGEARLLAVLHDSGYPRGIGAASVLAHFYGHDEIPLGAYQGPFGRVRDDYGDN